MADRLETSKNTESTLKYAGFVVCLGKVTFNTRHPNHGDRRHPTVAMVPPPFPPSSLHTTISQLPIAKQQFYAVVKFMQIHLLSLLIRLECTTRQATPAVLVPVVTMAVASQALRFGCGRTH